MPAYSAAHSLTLYAPYCQAVRADYRVLNALALLIGFVSMPCQFQPVALCRLLFGVAGTALHALFALMNCLQPQPLGTTGHSLAFLAHLLLPVLALLVLCLLSLMPHFGAALFSPTAMAWKHPLLFHVRESSSFMVPSY